MTKVFTSREFNQDVGQAKRAAQEGPVFITDRGRPAHVLLTIDAYRRLTNTEPSVADALGMEEGADIEFDPPRIGRISRPVDFD